MAKPIVLSYSNCSTCKQALAWLASHHVDVEVRAIATHPPTVKELASWIPASGVGIRKWLNTSGLSYRALTKSPDEDKVANATDSDLALWLSKDGKLVKRPVLVFGKHVLVGFREDAYAAVFAS
jgi:arsenate reductase (glutaredoxin)